MEEIKKIRTAVIDAVQSLNDEQLNKQVDEESWSIAQILEHLFLMESQIVNLIEDALKREEFEKPEGFPVYFVVNRSKKVTAPKNLVPLNTFQKLSDLEKKLFSSRLALESIVMNLNEDDLNHKTASHSRFGVLALKDWISLVGYHEQRHLLQIEEVKEVLSILEK